MNVARFALRHDKLIAFAAAFLAVLGIMAGFRTPQSIFPPMHFSRIDVVADAGDLPPDQVRIAIARPLEQAFSALPSVTGVQTTSSQGSAELFVNFAPSTDPRVDLESVNQAIAQVRGEIAAARNVVSVIVNPDSEPVLSYAFTSADLSQAVLRQIVLQQVAPKVYGTTGLGRLLVTGGPAVEYHVTLEPAKLAALGIGASEVSKALADANTVQDVGLMQRYYQRYAVIVDASLRDRAGLERVMVPTKNGTSVPLGNLGTVEFGVAPVTDQSSYDGHPAVILNLYAAPGADTVRMAAAVRRTLAGIVPHLPADIQLNSFWDQTTLIVESQKALRDAIVLGALLAICVIYLFLRNTRLTLVAAALIPLAMAIAMFALQRGGQTLNLMSVGGLAVAVGLIIDDAIVVIENIARNRRERPFASADDNIALSMSQLTRPMIASTATTVVVFLPLALLTGVSGFFFRALAFTLSAALIVSLLLGLLLAPNVARVLLGKDSVHRPRREGIAGMLSRYEPILRWALGHRLVVGLGSVAVLVLTVVLLARLPSDFLPKMDEGQFEIAYAMPPGTTLEASDAAARAMERIVASDPAVASVGRLTGIDSNGFSPTQPSAGLLRVRLMPPGRRSGYEAVSARLRDRLETVVPAARYDFHQILEDLINGLSGTPAPIEVSIFGPDQRTLMSLARRVEAKIRGVAGVVDTANGIVFDSPSIRVAPRGSVLASLGLASGDVADALAALGQGTVATRIPGSQAMIPVRVRVGALDQRAPFRDAGTPLLAKGVPTDLSDVARLTTVPESTDLNSENGQPLLRVTANIQGVTLSRVSADIQRALAQVPLPPGYWTEIGGQAKTQGRSFSEFLTVIAIAVALVYAVILAAFGSLRLPLIILATIPLALIGVALALALTGTPFNVSSFMGLLLLVGLVVKNGILLIDVANQRRAAGAGVNEALVSAGKTRLRPIAMTALAAIGGLFPLALGLGQGAEMERPLAIAVIGGLSTSTIFTLIVIPVLYAAITRSAPDVPITPSQVTQRPPTRATA